jgi:predicted small integral membrane protein
MLIRLSKASLVASSALFLLVVVFNNLTDYGSNFEFVRHVLSMDTTFPGNRLKWRAISTPALHHAFYWTIIAWEALSGLGIAAGALALWRVRGQSAAVFNAAKQLAVGALTANLVLWFTAFLTVGAEWFVMWQSQVWNGQMAATRMFTCVGLVLLILKTSDTDPVSPSGRGGSAG